MTDRELVGLILVVLGVVVVLALFDQWRQKQQRATRGATPSTDVDKRISREERVAVHPAAPSSATASTSSSGARSHGTAPRLLILLVDKMPPNGPEAHIRRLLDELSAQEIPEDIILRVTNSYADQSYIAATIMFTPVQQGIHADTKKTWYRSYSTADGITGTQVFIYE